MRSAALLFALLLPSSATRPASPDLATAISAAAGSKGPVWIAWEVPVSDPGFHACCYDTLESFERGPTMSGRCTLERERSWTMSRAGENEGNVLLGADDHRRLIVLVRMEDGAVERVRSVSDDCPVDPGNVPVVVLTGVRPAESVAFLAGLPRGGTHKKDGALAALSLHADPAAIPALIDLAHHDASHHVRGQSLFWLAQRAGTKAVGAISDAIANDPETEVKVRAVFALSQLPKEEGVPLLIDLARRNRNPAVRKKAMFWLGQSKDPRALAFIEEVLLK